MKPRSRTMSGDFLFAWWRLALCASALGSWCVVAAHADTWPITLTGQIAPKTGEGRFSGLGEAAVNGNGVVVFRAALTDGSAGEGIFQLNDGVLSPIALQGQIAPETAGLAFVSFGDPQINDAGDIAFIAVLTGGIRFEAIFLRTGQTLRKLVDTNTPPPGAPGQTFQLFRNLQINQLSDVAFQADVGSGGPLLGGIFLSSNGSLRSVVLSMVGSPPTVASTWLSLNNRREIAFISPDGVSVWSDGSIRLLAARGQTIGDSTLSLATADEPSINDDGDVVFINKATVISRFPALIPNAVVRWHAGQLEKIAATGDVFTGFEGVVFGGALGQPHINNAGAIIFLAEVHSNGSDSALTSSLKGPVS